MRQLRRAVEAAEVKGLFDLDAMQRFMARSRGRPGMRALRAVLEIYRQPVFTRSELERRFLDLCDSEALPRPAANFFVEGKEADMVWLDERLVVELDGRETHRTHAAFDPPDAAGCIRSAIRTKCRPRDGGSGRESKGRAVRALLDRV
jgi:hypothetical protein